MLFTKVNLIFIIQEVHESFGLIAMPKMNFLTDFPNLLIISSSEFRYQPTNAPVASFCMYGMDELADQTGIILP